MKLYIVRIPFKSKQLRNDFVIVKTSRDGQIKRGKIVHLEGDEIEYGSGKKIAKTFEGNISISSLNRKEVLNSAISNGYVTAFHNNLVAREETNLVYPSDELPEVVVVAHVHNYTTNDFSTWMWLNSFFYNTEGGSTHDGSGSYYASLDGGGNYDSGGGGGGAVNYSNSDGYGVNDPVMLVDDDSYSGHDAIDVDQYLKCFDAIPDVGAQFEIGIYADIPVDSDPNKLFDFSTGAPGHTFIGIKKTNGSQSILQYIGFYPKTGWKNTLTNGSIDGKFVNDGGHEYNASYLKTLTYQEFASVLNEIRYMKKIQYDIDNFNCTDWALDIFNKQGYGLEIPLYDIPGNLPATGTSTPQGVYNKLKEMKNTNAAHADQIAIGFLKGWVASSNGPCN